MNAILLAAGFGTRLGDLGKKTSKAFLPVGKLPAIDRVISTLSGSPIKNIHVVHNARFAFAFRRWKDSLVYQSDPGQKLGSPPYVKLHSDEVFYEDERVGAVGDLALVLSRLGEPRDFVLLLVDNIATFPVIHFLREVVAGGMDAPEGAIWITLRKVSPEKARELGTVTFLSGGKGATGQVLGFHEKNNAPSVEDQWTWLGPAYFPESAIPLIKKYCLERRAAGKDIDRLGDFMAWLVDNSVVYGWTSTQGEVFETGTMRGLEEAVGYFGR